MYIIHVLIKLHSQGMSLCSIQERSFLGGTLQNRGLPIETILYMYQHNYTTFHVEVYMKLTLTLNRGESASVGTGTMISTLLAVERLLN